MPFPIGPTESNNPPSPATNTTRRIEIRLEGPEYGRFDGALTYMEVDAAASVERDADVERRIRSNLQRLIDGGRIRYNEPGYEMKLPQDYFDPQRRPFVGVVHWQGSQMVIERLPVATR